MKSSPPKGIKVHTLIPCNYLDTFVFDGRSNPEGDDRKTQIITQNLKHEIEKYKNIYMRNSNKDGQSIMRKLLSFP